MQEAQSRNSPGRQEIKRRIIVCRSWESLKGEGEKQTKVEKQDDPSAHALSGWARQDQRVHFTCALGWQQKGQTPMDSTTLNLAPEVSSCALRLPGQLSHLVGVSATPTNSRSAAFTQSWAVGKARLQSTQEAKDSEF
jgi:hypothetical protein